MLAACAGRQPPGGGLAEQTTRSPVAQPDSLEAVEPSELDTNEARPQEERSEAPEPPVTRKRGECDQPEAPPTSGAAAEVREMLDDTAEVLEETSCSAALWLDGLFGEDRNLESARRTSGFVEASGTYSEFKGFEEKLRFRVRFKLPNLKSRFTAIVGRDDEDEIQRDRTERFAVRSQLRGFEDDSAWLAGLGYSLPGTQNFSSDLRVGVSSVRHPKLFVQQPTRYVLFSDANDLLYIRGTPFWNTRDGFGFTAGFNYNHVLTRKLMVRLTQIGTISQKTDGYDWFSGAILYRNLRGERALAYQLLIRGATDAPEPLEEYGARIVYRHPLIARKLYADLLTGYTWPREDPEKERKGSAEVGLSLEMPFGRSDD